MIDRRTFIGGAATLAAAFAAAPFGARAAGIAVDLDPRQAGRVRTARDPAAADAARRYRWVADGAFTVAIAPHAPPVATFATDARTVVGADPDYAQLIADALGRRLALLPVAWADWPLGLSAGKYDAVISNVGVTEKRKEKFDFTTYRLGLHGFYVRAASPIARIAEPKDVAGLRIITGSGTSQERILLEWNRRNVARGLRPADVLYFDDDGASRVALLSGRADAELNPNATLAYQAARDGKIRCVGNVNAGWPVKADVAIATRKGSGLADALTLATNDLIRSGKYRQALARWGLLSEAVDESETNPPGLPSF
ncbi:MULTISPECIES: ABC transporter substrate-binding protein [Burkholderia]|uniref:ABC transporter substrate-binding protein n=1 Tax=Burkholderia savannae TaxID=1637837 RepID=A0ABR5T8D3_9BURK|nr:MULTISPECIES: ABC transporter substrate-binding protein [Burkholderia]AOJ71140.1 ABC transporter substrate-binding protein [Burkholderia savannae]AOK49534.1 ABC transporter substrate-binding protein [Burkholderia sp. MSMB617WGS]KGS08513.1 bacterial extracellular solute-binding s, 3 family protein [Burkholderia sp. ABCPW 111]KVG48792.1 ABC transporter substrate-binding protein [Burkholderia sp. MSMB0265]KVG86252.1 ABC transporter substrate-binding protein [Burkholderia sp. MSMB2040]